LNDVKELLPVYSTNLILKEFRALLNFEAISKASAFIDGTCTIKIQKSQFKESQNEDAFQSHEGRLKEQCWHYLHMSKNCHLTLMMH
jgi:hypothetical protein